MWQEDMDRARVYRVGGARPYQRGSFVPSTMSRQMDDRLHSRGVSTSSNSSWTFSNGKIDGGKSRTGGVCGAVLLAAIFVVVAAVVCVGGLAFYMGAKRVDSSSSSLVLDGNIRVTYGDQFKSDLLDASSELFLEKAERYQQMIRIVLQKSTLNTALKDVAVMRFTNGSNLHVGFRVHLDRRKLPEGVNALEAVRAALLQEFGSVKPAAFRNMQVDLHRLVHNKGDDDINYEGARLEVEPKGIVRKPTSDAPVQEKPKILTPVKGTVQMTDLGETIKLKNAGPTTEKKEEIKSIEFKNDPPEEEIIVKEVVQEVKAAALSTTTTTEKSLPTQKPVSVTKKPSKVFQSIYITSDNVRITNASKTDGPVGSYKVNKPEPQSPVPSTSIGGATGSFKITKTDTGVKSDSIFTVPAEVVITPAIKESTTTRTTTKERNTVQIIRATTWSPSVNGHARPPAKDQVPEPVNVGFALIGTSEEPWRPIIPTRSPRIPTTTTTTTEPYSDFYDLILDERDEEKEVEIDDKAPITFSKKVYDENLRVIPELTEKGKPVKTNVKLSKITEEIAKKYKEIMKHQVPVESVEVKSEETVLTTSAAPPVTIKVSPTVVVNPFKEADDSRSSSALTFGIPELPILQQFHHLDSLLKSFAGGTAAGGSPGNFVTPPYSTSTSTNVPTSSVSSSITPITTTSVVTTSTPYITSQSPSVDTTTPTTTTTVRTTTKRITRAPETSSKKPFSTTTRRFITRKTTTEPVRKPSTVSQSTEQLSTRFPIRRRPTAASNETVYVAVSTFSPTSKYRSENNQTNVTTSTTPRALLRTTTLKTTPTQTTPTAPDATTLSTVAESRSEPFLVKGEVEVLDQPSGEGVTTEQTKLVTLLPVRSNVNMRSPLRRRPPSRRAREQPHRFVDDEDGGRWIYYSSSKMTSPSEKLFIVTPQPPSKETPIDLPIYNTIEQLLNADHRTRQTASFHNTSDIVQRIVQQMDNVAIASENSSSMIVKINSTVLRKAALPQEMSVPTETVNSVISTKAVSGTTSYKINQSGVPILTKVLRKEPPPAKVSGQNEDFEKIPPKEQNSSMVTSGNVLNEGVSSHIHPTECMNSSVRCGNGVCLPPSSRCNQLVDCPDASDEKNCTCAEHLKAQRLNRKLCDGVVDCWDFSDELNCDWCKPEQHLCSNSRSCIDMSQVCDGVAQCPHGDDERFCVRVAPSTVTPGGDYHASGFLMVRKHGVWGKLCVDDFESVSKQSHTGWKLSDLGRSVCRALTYKDFDKVERAFSIPNEGRSLTIDDASENYFELSLKGDGAATGRDSSLTFHSSTCPGKQVARVTCRDLECGVRPQVAEITSRIVGGGNASPGAWPWQAALYREGEFQCGATLVTNSWLISAGHCFYHNQEEWWVARLGALRTSSSLPSPHEQIHPVAQIIVHPQYVDSGFLNDIALLRLAGPVRLTDHVRPICLPPPTATVHDGAVCTVVGWGQLFELGRVFPDTLQEVEVPVISSVECRKRTLFLPLYKITDDMLCAGYERGGRDACLGDSGGPLMCQEKDGRYALYGVTSNGYGCARSNRPGVYTKVTRYLPWIHARIHADLHNVTGRDKLDRCKGHRCPLGECLPKSRLCNGYVECSDGSDEKDCW